MNFTVHRKVSSVFYSFKFFLQHLIENLESHKRISSLVKILLFNLVNISLCVVNSKYFLQSDIMTLGRSIFQAVVLLLAIAHLGRSIEISDFYDFEREIRLENGANKFEFVKLDTSINFFSDIYDHIYVSFNKVFTNQSMRSWELPLSIRRIFFLSSKNDEIYKTLSKCLLMYTYFLSSRSVYGRSFIIIDDWKYE